MGAGARSTRINEGTRGEGREKRGLGRKIVERGVSDMLTIHASRSRQEAFHLCRRYGFLQYHYEGRGIVRKGKNIFLSTGIWTHKGLELIGKWLKANKTRLVPEYVLDHIVSKIKQGYFEYVFPQGKDSQGFDLISEVEWGGEERRELTRQEKQAQQQYVFNEQSALCEAFIRIFASRIVPQWLEQFNIVTVENDMAFPFIKGEGFEVIQSATLDWVLQEIDSKDLFVVSFKTAKSWDNRTAKGASHDTQGLSETWAFDEYLRGKGIDKQIMGVKMLYLIKGQRKEVERGSGVYEQVSPLIRGYKKFELEGVQYAHSWFYPKPENKSGVGAIGNSWTKFDVFQGEELQEIGGVKGWLALLEQGDIQPECGDVIGSQLIEPESYSRQQLDIDSWLRQSRAFEAELASKLLRESEFAGEGIAYYMDLNFPQNRRACHYPTDCPYLSVCHGTVEERSNPLENGFEFRVPHHAAELVKLKGLG